ncbi:MAG: hypothetical protein MJ137_02410 [Clostridia bacterium]|nr:hypothetical protein [Clostridia bacterium]
MKMRRVIGALVSVLVLSLQLISLSSASIKHRDLIYLPLRYLDEHVGSSAEDYNPVALPIFGYLSQPNDYSKVNVENLRNICYRNTGVEFAEGDEFSIDFNGVTVTHNFHANNGDLCEFEAEFGDCKAVVSVFKNGDFKSLMVIKYPDNCPKNNMSSEEVASWSKDLLDYYNRNLITGEKIVNLDEFEFSPYMVEADKRYFYFTMPKKNGWWLFDQASVTFDTHYFPYYIFICNPGHYDDCDVPDFVSVSTLEEHLLPLLRNYKLLPDDEGIILDCAGFPPGVPPTYVVKLTDGTVGLMISVRFSKNGEWTGASSHFVVPFSSLGLR